ncbi:MAG: T9SS type A sorting domain-containing protein [Chitinophagaceae bacterium]|nr:T9SS type A sorting domain-containing protein [Chitinophagaceae bacterium]
MKKRFLTAALLIILLLPATGSKAQCPGGWTAAQTNWDWLDYLVNGGNYAPTGNYPGVPAALAATQAFALGTNRFTIAYAGGIACTLGENVTHTGEAGSFATGADVQYANNGTVTITFDTLVRNVQFSLYDIDVNQTATVTASDGAAAQVVNMVAVNGGVNLIVAGSPGLAPVATATAAAFANNLNNAALNVTIAGALTGVKTVVITIGGTAGDWWLSDINACVVKTFTNNYYLDARPFTGQNTYILATPDSNSVSYIDSATGRGRFLFSGNLAGDANSPDYVNGLAYDHKNHYLYYVHDFGNNAYNTRTIRMWDYNTESISALNFDVNTIGIPTFDIGVESAGASFYDGSLYFGVEAHNGSRNSNREAIIWRIDFNAAGTPYRSSQVFAVPSDNGGGTLMHDWNDFVLNNGILYDFDGAGTTTQDNYYHFDMQTGQMLQNYTTAPTHNVPRQVGNTWSGAIIWAYDSIGVYNGTGGVGAKLKIFGNSPNYFPDWAKGPSGFGRSGDAAGPFKPKTDFGDAPATYDPATGDPATHEMDSTIKIGVSEDREFAKKGVTGTEDTDNGIASLSVFDPGTQTYLVQVSVYNNSGSPARLIAWFDYNGNGVFNSSEAITPITVNSSSSQQQIWLWWPGIISSLPNGSFTYLRVRLTSVSNGMTTSNPTGFYDDGEVEDYRVLVDNFPLAVNMVSFEAALQPGKKVKLNWTANEDPGFISYAIERSSDSRNWQHLEFIAPAAGGGLQNYEEWDNQPLPGVSYYRLKMISSGNSRYSDVRIITNNTSGTDILITPNPAYESARIRLQRTTPAEAKIRVMNAQGAMIYRTTVVVNGTAYVDLPVSLWMPGTYIVQVITNNEVVNQKLIVK